MKKIIVFGSARQKTVKTIDVLESDLDQNLMTFLQDHGIPVASSCSGDGVCLKCKVTIESKILLSCQLKVRELLVSQSSCTVTFSYL